MVEAKQLREVVAEFLSNEDVERQDWPRDNSHADKFVLDFAKLSYNIHKEGTPEALDFANQVEFRMADLHAGCISKSGFIDALRNL